MQYAGPPVSGIFPGAHEQTSKYGQIVPLPCGHLVDRKAKEVNPERKTGVKPHRQICDQNNTLLAASAVELVPNVLGFLSFGAYQQRQKRDPDAWATQVLHIICSGLHPGEDIPASPGVDTTREAAVTGYKPYC